MIYACTGKPAELLVEHGCGEAIEPENPAALADAIELLAADPVRRGEFGRLGRQWVEAEYSWSGIVETWLRESGLVPGGPGMAKSATSAAAVAIRERGTAR